MIRELFVAIYNIILFMAQIALLPKYFLKKKVDIECLKGKLFIGVNLGQREKSIWLQAVSVGEVLLLKRIVRELKAKFNYRIIVSSTTLTGFSLAKKMYSGFAKVIYFPMDLTPVIRRAIEEINPILFISVETEIWPNLFSSLKRKKVPIIIVNGRISDNSFRRYKIIRFVIKKVLRQCRYIGVQNGLYRQRFLALGAEDKKVFVTGNLKFCNVIFEQEEWNRFCHKYRPLFKLKEEYIWLLGASTHPGEEEILLDVYNDLKGKYPLLRLILAPRHLERIVSIEKEIREKRLVAKTVGEVNSCFNNTYVLVVNTIGELFYFYGFSDISFVGGSLIPHGGHNILEPAYFGKPIIFGPYMNNFSDMRDLFLRERAALEVKNKQELKETIITLLEDRNLYDLLSANAPKILVHGEKIWENTWLLIERCLS